jgi:cytidylate kinase
MTDVAPVVTLAALFGAGGHVVGPRVAERLGVPFLDRGILAGVAEQMHVPEQVVAEYDSETPKKPRSALRRYFEGLGRVTTADGSPVSNEENEEARYRSETEEFIARATEAGGVVLGRGGVVALGTVPAVLHVLLGGPREARIRQGNRLRGLDHQNAQPLMDVTHPAPRGYVRRMYGVDPEDADLFHLRIDSTAIDLDTCVDLIVAAAAARTRPSTDTTADG